MRILGLTGSIGMGKSTAAAMFRRHRIPVHDADAAVHRLMAPDGSCFAAVAEAFPGVIIDKAIDRRALGAIVFADADARRRLEAIVHPAVRAAEAHFLKIQARMRADTVVLDIPLLFETGAQSRCDAVVVVTAPKWLQKRRVLGRDGMTEDRFEQIVASQVPDRTKRANADYLLHSGLGCALTYREIAAILSITSDTEPWIWPSRYPHPPRSTEPCQ